MSLLEIGKEIKKIRKERGYTQDELAKMVGISRATLSKIENGFFSKISVTTFENILSTLGYNLTIKPKNPFIKRQ